MSMYEQPQWNMHERAHDRLRMLQKERREREQAEFEEAAEETMKNADTSYTPAPYAPATDGFVFQLAEIKQFIRRRGGLECAKLYRMGGSKRALTAFSQAA